MDICVAYNIAPFFCAVIDGITLPPKDVQDRKKTIDDLLDNIVPGGTIWKDAVSPSGQLRKQLLIVLRSIEDCHKFRGEWTDDGTIQLNDEKMYHISWVFEEKPRAVAQPNSAFIRRIKPFSGCEKVGAGECDVFEWVAVATEIVEHEDTMAPCQKLRYLKNSLVKDALTLVATNTNIYNPVELIDLISRTYGVARTAKRLWTDFYRLKQEKGEKPSAYLTRIQKHLLEIERVSPTQVQNQAESRIMQFSQGLRKMDYDTLCLHMNLQTYEKVGNYPQYSQLLLLVQEVERDRVERVQREGGEVSRAMINSVSPQPHEDDGSQASGKSYATMDDLEKLFKKFVASTQDKMKVESDSQPKSKSKNKGKKKTAKSKRHQEDDGDDDETVSAAIASQFSASEDGNPKHKGQVCFNCDKPGHVAWKCPQKLDEAKIAKRIAEMGKRWKARNQKSDESSESTTKDSGNWK